MLDNAICEEARRRRDPQFDGEFFIGVRTTRIYCRPVCPAGPALARNVVFFPTAAAAERHGYRPCLRCRPETAPFCPAWMGTRTTVSRALGMIDAGALDREGVGAIADRLGVGTRHLTRLFARHLGASPLQVAKTRRVARAKVLLDDPSLTNSEIAALSGFRSARRMSAAFLALYGRSPTSLRREPSKRLTA